MHGIHCKAESSTLTIATSDGKREKHLDPEHLSSVLAFPPAVQPAEKSTNLPDSHFPCAHIKSDHTSFVWWWGRLTWLMTCSQVTTILKLIHWGKSLVWTAIWRSLNHPRPWACVSESVNGRRVSPKSWETALYESIEELISRAELSTSSDGELKADERSLPLNNSPSCY